MEMPHVKNELRDAENGVTYVVLAYRTLTRGEILTAVRVFHQSRKSKKKLKKGTTITIVSLIGAA